MNNKVHSCNQNRDPLLLAEHLCSPCTQRLATGRKPTSTPATLLNKAWLLAEAGIVSGDPSSRQFLDRTETTVTDVLQRPLSLDVRRRGLALRAVVPAMRERAKGASVSRESIRYANGVFGEMLTHDSNALPNNNGGAAEALCFYLMSREGMSSDYFLFPTSQREESSTPPRFNHDAYFTWPTTQGALLKHPSQIKAATTPSTSKYDVPIIVVDDVLRPVRQANPNATMEKIVAMAAFEAVGITSNLQEVTLDFAGHCVESALKSQLYAAAIGNSDDRITR